MDKEFDILLARDFDGSISIEEQNRLNELCSNDDSYRRLYTSYKKIKYVSNPPFDIDSIDLDAAENVVMKKINSSASDNNKSAPQFILWWQRVAAVLIIPLLVASIYLWTGNNRDTQSVKSLQTVTTLPGTRSQLTLPDGSVVWLNSGSILKFPMQFEGNERRVTLEGEGYFAINSSNESPFYIDMNGAEVMVTGTELNVECYPNDSNYRVILVNGRANVITHENIIVDLKPNQCFSANTITGESDLYFTDANLYGKWRDGILAFRDESLENVFKRIGRTFNTDIKIIDNRLANHKYRATFEYESLQQILDAIELSAPIKYNYRKITDGESSKTVIEVSYK